MERTMNMDRRLPVAALAALLLAGCASAPREPKPTDVAADDPEAVRCVQLNRVDRTKVVDAENIFFYMRDGTVYRNQLPRPCPGLYREERFMYKVPTGRLCDLDIITVLTDFAGGLRQGASCGLGRFHPIDPEEADDLIEILQRDE